MQNNNYSRGLFTYKMHHVPYYGNVRVIFTEGVKSTHQNDGYKEFNVQEIMTDPSLEPIRERLMR